MLTGYFTTMHDWLCHLATFYIDMIMQKGDQVTKPIMHGCKIPCEHVLEVKGFLINNWLNFLALPNIRAFNLSCWFIHNAASSWPHTFFTP